jgi:hypothetical protein
LIFSDYTFEGVMGENDVTSLGGIYMSTIGSSTLMVYWALINIFLLFIKKIGWIINNLKGKRIFTVLIITFFFSIFGFIYNVTTPANLVVQTAFSDVRIYVNVFLGFLTISFIVESRNDLIKYFNSIILVLLTQLAITIIASYAVSRIQTIYTFYSGTETYLLSLPFLYFLFLIQQKKRNPANSSIPTLFLIGGMLIVILFLFVVPSRGRIFALIFPLAIYLVYSKKWQYVLLFPLLVIASIYLVHLINPNFYNYFLWKLTTFNPHAENADSSRMRYVEFLNIIGEVSSNPYYFIFGKGFGGYFQTDFFGLGSFSLGRGSFPQPWINEGKFYKPHGSWLYFILKFGIVMTVFFYYYVYKLFSDAWKTFKKLPFNFIRIIGLCFLFNLPNLSIIMFSSKLQILFGVLIGFLYLSLKYSKKQDIII